MGTAKQTPIGIGVDPEVFAIDTINCRYTTAYGMIPGTKEKPFPVKNGAVQVDGMALEYNTRPAYTALEFAQYNTDVLAELKKIVPKGIDICIEPVVYFDKIFFDSLPSEPKELGCSPDFNAFNGCMNTLPTLTGPDAAMRTGSGHIHVSWTSNADIDDISHRWDCETVVKALESTVGQYIRLWDSDTKRQSLYGKPGAFRYKPYGVEWRRPSNAWLRHPEIWEWLFEAVKFTVELVRAGKWDRNTIYKSSHLSKRSDINKFFKAAYPGFPEMPPLKNESEVTEAVDKSTKTGRSRRKMAISPTQRTTTLDIDLDTLHDSSLGETNIYVDF